MLKRRCAALAWSLLAIGTLGVHPAGATSGPAIEPVKIQRVELPSRITEASTPVFTRDGHHLLFFSAQHLWVVSGRGSELTCLSCGLPNEPKLDHSEQEGFATEFPDGRRVFFGAAGSVAVLECHPSVIACRERRILPIDLSGAHGSPVVAPGGAVAGPTLNQANASSPKLAPDGVHIAFSDIRTDEAEVMVIATLTRSVNRYVTSDPRVINPAGPTSPTDMHTLAWSDSAGLFEFKTFMDGGADATYVQVGGGASGNPDVWKVNLATGARTRLTSYPDWDEDNAPSPNGRSIVVESDRGMHRVDMFGALMPVRGFFDDPEVAALASYFVAGPIPRQCDLQPWLLPASGDRGGRLMGQPIQPYAGGQVHAANNVSGYPQWSPDGTEIALNTESYRTNRSAPYLLIARLVSRRSTTPEPIVSSQPGSWAPSPARYHGSIGAVDNIVLRGLRAGTATVFYDNTGGLLTGRDAVTLRHYSDNGRDFVSGTSTIVNASILNGPVKIDEDMTMTGANTGYVHVHATFGGISKRPVTISGTASSNYDGTTVSGIPRVPQTCPGALPRAPALRLRTQLAGRALRVMVTATIGRAGPNERGRDTRPVRDATVRLGALTVHTDPRGSARLRLPRLPRGGPRLFVTAGDTLLPASKLLRP